MEKSDTEDHSRMFGAEIPLAVEIGEQGFWIARTGDGSARVLLGDAQHGDAVLATGDCEQLRTIAAELGPVRQTLTNGLLHSETMDHPNSNRCLQRVWAFSRFIAYHVFRNSRREQIFFFIT